MFTNIRIHKTTPGKTYRYVSDKNIMPEMHLRNLYSKNLSPIAEMQRTAERFGKWTRPEARKTITIVISPNPADNPTPEQVLEVTNAVLDKFFPNLQGGIALHLDKKGTADSRKTRPILHSHFVGSIVDPITGGNAHLGKGQVREIQMWADQYAHEYFGWEPFRPKDRSSHNRYREAVMKALAARGSYSWRMHMRELIEKHLSEAEDYKDFLRRLSTDGIGVISSYRNRKTGETARFPELRFSFRYRGKLMVVKASTVSEKLTPSLIEKRFSEMGGKHGQVWGFSYKGQGQSFTAKNLGTGRAGGQPKGRENSGEGHVGVSNGKADFHCIICEHDREICEMCSRFERWQGGSHERSARTR